jgi:hypothetical protein
MASSLPIALVIHGHFYQPPRENPWTDQVPREPSAAPQHDWNARISAECYRANAFARIYDTDGHIEAIVNNYERLSFNFGPTLARWVASHDPEVQERLRAADQAQLRRLGAGGAIAQAYAHPILPLCNRADRRTQIIWGLADFRRRFGRDADGLWLPETAVSPEVLEALIELGVKFTILAPEQIDAVRGPATALKGEPEWQEVDRDTLDTGRAYYWPHRDGSGRKIALAVFDGPLSRAVAFGDAATRAESFLDAVRTAADRSSIDGPSDTQRLVLCASDGELWGHHKKFADLTLAFASHIEAARRGMDVTNLGAYLARNPPTWEARLAPGPEGEGTAWSCAHGVGRWQRDCGCSMGSGVGWNQAWRTPLRGALDLIRDAAARFYEEAAGELYWDPWGARDAYGDVVDDPPHERHRALAWLARPALESGGEEAETRAIRLLELQRATLLMYASCGWFFDDVAGLEASLTIRMGAQALDMLRELGGEAPEHDVLELLALARSNDRDAGTGADVYRRVARHRVTAEHAIGYAALATIAADEEARAVGAELGGATALPREIDAGYDVRLSDVGGTSTGGTRTLSGRATAVHRRTGVVEHETFVARVRPGGAFEAELGGRRLALEDLGDEARGALVMAALPELLPDIRSPAVARLVVAAARELPPDGETPEGVARRAALAHAVLVLLEGTPSAEALRLAADLVDLLKLAPGAPARRAIEERVWALGQHGRPSPALRALADRIGFTARERVVVGAAS